LEEEKSQITLSNNENELHENIKMNEKSNRKIEKKILIKWEEVN